ncbi:hypothetical protein HGA88_05660 [Candidatus Roizmanbacteria bacterium]|nr:hypothetical protein [Candidatus Roizmanbacteria bacterium]
MNEFNQNAEPIVNTEREQAVAVLKDYAKILTHAQDMFVQGKERQLQGQNGVSDVDKEVTNKLTHILSVCGGEPARKHMKNMVNDIQNKDDALWKYVLDRGDQMLMLCRTGEAKPLSGHAQLFEKPENVQLLLGLVNCHIRDKNDGLEYLEHSINRVPPGDRMRLLGMLEQAFGGVQVIEDNKVSEDTRYSLLKGNSSYSVGWVMDVGSKYMSRGTIDYFRNTYGIVDQNVLNLIASAFPSEITHDRSETLGKLVGAGLLKEVHQAATSHQDNTQQSKGPMDSLKGWLQRRKEKPSSESQAVIKPTYSWKIEPTLENIVDTIVV